MKVLIYIVCFFGLGVFINELRSNGIYLGGLPVGLLYGGMFWIARTLCKKWDSHKAKKALNDAVSKGMNALDFVKSKTPGAFLDQLESERQCEGGLTTYLDSLVKSKKLPREYADVLFAEYMKPRDEAQGD